jgi:hypothetical protein
MELPVCYDLCDSETSPFILHNDSFQSVCNDGVMSRGQRDGMSDPEFLGESDREWEGIYKHNIN